ncbi:hypothetical protein BJY00DRAFT_304224 [Aspergillus carlsbadensis]|nr:hypothetical protein BJY00DRAFT_304224 [Aspergillus carlsbadensis]
MSGLEVVGVVLGALPLMIAAVDHYKTTSQRIKLFRYKEPLIADLIQALQEQQFFLETDLAITLKAASLDDDEIADLLTKPDATVFGDPDVAMDVQKYLGAGYGPYTAAAARCQRILSDIAKHIRGLASSTQRQDLAGIVDANPAKDGRYELAKKIKFSLDRDDLERRIKELEDATERLRRVRDYSTLQADVPLETTSRATTRYTSKLRTVRDYAQRLHNAISGGYAAGCHHEHETYLFLESRSESMESKKQKALKEPPIGFSLALPPVAPKLQGAVSCYVTEVKVRHEDEHSVSSAADPAGSSPAVVQIVLPPPPTAHPRPTKIDDLCRSVSTATMNGTLLKLYLSQSGCLSCNHLPLTNGPGRHVNWADLLSLEQILDAQPQSQVTLPIWTRNQRIALALNIASSLLQLYSTHWLTTSLTSKSIYFTTQSVTPNTVPCQQFTKPPMPFVTHKFRGVSSQPTKFPIARDSLLELDIILLELWHFRTLESFAAENQLPTGDSFGVRCDAARKWLDMSRYFLLPFYLEVVTRCIECTFATSSSLHQWDDVVFRRSICEYVLRPLWEHCLPEFR